MLIIVYYFDVSSSIPLVAIVVLKVFHIDLLSNSLVTIVLLSTIFGRYTYRLLFGSVPLSYGNIGQSLDSISIIVLYLLLP